MSDCKEISWKEFETYLRIKEFIERNFCEKADSRNMVQGRTPLIIHSDDMEPKRYECLSDAANHIKVSRKLSYMCTRIRGLLLPGGKVELKFLH